MGEGRSAKVAVGMSAAAAIAAALVWIKSSSAEAAPENGGGLNMSDLKIPEEFVNLIAAIAASADGIDENTLRLIQEIGKLGINVQGFPNNVKNIQTVRVVCTVAARAYQLPDITIPNGMQLTIKAWPFNGNLIYVGEDQAAAININRIHALAASEQVFYYVQSAKTIWVSAIVPGDSVTITSEKTKGGV